MILDALVMCIRNLYFPRFFWLGSEYNRFWPMDLVNCNFAQVLIAVSADSVGFSARKVVSRAPQDHPQIPGLPGGLRALGLLQSPRANQNQRKKKHTECRGDQVWPSSRRSTLTLRAPGHGHARGGAATQGSSRGHLVLRFCLTCTCQSPRLRKGTGSAKPIFNCTKV